MEALSVRMKSFGDKDKSCQSINPQGLVLGTSFPTVLGMEFRTTCMLGKCFVSPNPWPQVLQDSEEKGRAQDPKNFGLWRWLDDMVPLRNLSTYSQVFESTVHELNVSYYYRCWKWRDKWEKPYKYISITLVLSSLKMCKTMNMYTF